MPTSSIDFRRLFYALPSPYMMLDRDLRFIDMNDRYLEVTERSRDELIGRYVFDAFPEGEERRGQFRSAFERAVAGEANRLVKQPFSIPRPEGGMREVWWTCHHMPVHDGSGAVIGMVQKAEDVTAEVMAERMREAISREFDHRVKNILSTVAAIARRTAQGAQSPQEFVRDLDGRIGAMARTHDMLIGRGGTHVSLGDLIVA